MKEGLKEKERLASDGLIIPLGLLKYLIGHKIDYISM